MRGGRGRKGEKRGWEEGEEGAGGWRGEKNGEGGGKRKIFARAMRAPLQEGRQGGGRGGKGAGGGDAYPLSAPSYLECILSELNPSK